MNKTEYGLVLPFNDQSESFVHGFEAGQIWQRLEQGDSRIEITAHRSNKELIERMAWVKKYSVKTNSADVMGWIEVLITPLKEAQERE